VITSQIRTVHAEIHVPIICPTLRHARPCPTFLRHAFGSKARANQIDGTRHTLTVGRDIDHNAYLSDTLNPNLAGHLQ
jgi:hypothetical protein